MSTNDVLKLIPTDTKTLFMLPIISVCELLLLSYSTGYAYYVGCVVPVISVLVIYVNLNRLLTATFSMTNYQISINKTNLPSGYLGKINYSRIKNPKQTRKFLRVNDIPVICPTPVVPDSSYIFNFGSVVALITSIVIPLVYIRTQHRILFKFVQVNFVLQMFDTFKPRNFKTAFLLLWAFFLHDIYFVCFTDIIETAANGVDFSGISVIPDLHGGFRFFGLNDIFVPGLFINLCAKYNKSYYIYNVIAYNIGLLELIAATAIFHTEQPTLIYTVPNLLLTTLMAAWWRQELSGVWSFEVFNYEDKESDDESEDVDYEPNSEDEWQTRVDELDTDIDDPNSRWSDIDEQELRDVRIDAVYNFIDESDDDTFVISNGESDDDETQEDSEEDLNDFDESL